MGFNHILFVHPPELPRSLSCRRVCLSYNNECSGILTFVLYPCLTSAKINKIVKRLIDSHLGGLESLLSNNTLQITHTKKRLPLKAGGCLIQVKNVVL